MNAASCGLATLAVWVGETLVFALVLLGKNMVFIERFIDFVMIKDNMVPLIPTIVPMIIIMIFCCPNPIATDAQPDKEFKTEITIGISAPPIGKTNNIPHMEDIIPNMMIQIVGNIATTFGPKLTYLYADNKIESIQYEVKKNIKLLSLLATIPTGIILVFGECFFELWVPSQNARVLSVLSSLTLLGVLVSGVSQCISNVFGVVNILIKGEIEKPC